MSQFSQYGNVTVTEIVSFKQESLRSLDWALRGEDFKDYAEEITEFWDNQDDVIDLGGGTKVLTYARVLKAGEERLKAVLSAIDKKKRRRGTTLAAYDMIHAALLRAAQEENSLQ